MTDETMPFRSGSYKIVSFDHRTTEQLIPFTTTFSDSISQASYSEQADAEEAARELAARAPSYLTFAVLQIQQVTTVTGVQPAGRRDGDPFQDMARRLEGLPWG